MAPVKVQALYDFSGEPGSSELSIVAGEVLTVTRQDVGEGWWEGTNQQGQTGLFPAAYVEIQELNVGNLDPLANETNYEVTDFWEEEWDDDSEGPPPPLPPDNPTMLCDPNPPIEARPGDSKAIIGRTNFNRYSTFVKTGGESYILGNTPAPFIPEGEKIKIVLTESGIMWSQNGQPYICMIASPKKESKLKGLKSYIAYQLTPSFNKIPVSRRYKHFDWLHERLEEKYSLIPIPPLPDKQISGRYEDQFIEHRKNQLQAFVDCVCRHPVLSRSAVWEHFITCNDEKLWKTGKRKAEKDELVGANYFYALEAPKENLNNILLDQETISCSDFVQNMDGAIKHFYETTTEQTKKHQNLYKRDFHKIGHAISELGVAMTTDQPKYYGHDNLTSAIKASGDAYIEIGQMFEEQPKLDWEPLGDMLYVYKGILASMPDILSLHRKALQTKKECQKLTFEQKMTTTQLEGVSKRTDVVSYALLSEINHFQNERAEEVSKSLKNFLSQQIIFYQKITDKLQQALKTFDA